MPIQAQDCKDAGILGQELQENRARKGIDGMRLQGSKRRITKPEQMVSFGKGRQYSYEDKIRNEREAVKRREEMRCSQ
jgi:hypothetical protein